jgi:hypothetical protein
MNGERSGGINEVHVVPIGKLGRGVRSIELSQRLFAGSERMAAMRNLNSHQDCGRSCGPA